MKHHGAAIDIVATLDQARKNLLALYGYEVYSWDTRADSGRSIESTVEFFNLTAQDINEHSVRIAEDMFMKHQYDLAKYGVQLHPTPAHIHDWDSYCAFARVAGYELVVRPKNPRDQSVLFFLVKDCVAMVVPNNLLESKPATPAAFGQYLATLVGRAA